MKHNTSITFGTPDDMTPSDIGLALYHIANKTILSRDFTVEFIDEVILRASTLLYSPLYHTTPASKVLDRIDELTTDTGIIDFVSFDAGYNKIVEYTTVKPKPPTYG